MFPFQVLILKCVPQSLADLVAFDSSIFAIRKTVISKMDYNIIENTSGKLNANFIISV